MLAIVNLQPLHNLISEHPIACVLTVAFCLVVIIAGLLFCYGVIKAK